MAIAFCRGSSVHDNKPRLLEAGSFEDFAAALDKDRAPQKASAGYFCGPMNGNGMRCAAGAIPRRWLAVDLDRIAAERLPDVRMWFAGFSGFGWPTHSSTPQAPRERVVLELDRDATRAECIQIGRVLVRDMHDAFGDAVYIDPTTFRGEQPVFLPPSRIALARFFGEPLRVDEMLAGAAQLPPDAPEVPAGDGVHIIAGGRNSYLSKRAYALRKQGQSIEGIELELQAINRARIVPPLAEAEVRAIAQGKRIVQPDERPEPPPNAPDEPAGELAPGRPDAGLPDDATGELITSDKGVIKPCEHNAYQLLAGGAPYRTLRYDEFLARMRIHERDWTDADDLDAVRWLQGTHRVAGFNLSQARNAAKSLAYARRHDSLQDFIAGLPAWDGQDRIEMAFCDAWGTEDSPLMRAASANFFIAMIARARTPGAQVDTLFTFEGAQGSFKSKSLRALGGTFHAEISAAIGTADFQRELRGLWLAEMSELDSLRGKEATTIKRLLSAPADRFVQKYALHAESYPRRAVAVATTNEATYWQDSTGARRLVPISCGDIRIDLITQHRLQWFAEAAHRHAAGQSWWEYPDTIAAAQDERQQVDPWEDILRAAMSHGRKTLGGSQDWPEGAITSASIMGDWLKLEPSQQGPVSATRLGRVMRRLGFVPKRIGLAQARGWELPEKTAPEDENQPGVW